MRQKHGPIIHKGKYMNNNTSLFDEEPISISPSLAAIMGLDRSVLLQIIHTQVHKISLLPHVNQELFIGGFYWVKISIASLFRLCPYFGSEKTIQRLLKSLMDLSIIEHKRTRGNESYYRVNYENLGEYKRANYLTAQKAMMSKFVTERKLTSRKDKTTYADEELLLSQYQQMDFLSEDHGQFVLPPQDKLSYPPRTNCPTPPGQIVLPPQDNLSVVGSENEAMTDLNNSLNKDAIYYLNNNKNGLNKDSNINASKKTGRPATAKKFIFSFDELQEKFASFWETYLKGVEKHKSRKIGRDRTFTKFINPPDENKKKHVLTDDLLKKIIRATELYNEHVFPYRDTEFVPKPENFIGKGYWNNSEEDIIKEGEVAKQMYFKVRGAKPPTKVDVLSGVKPIEESDWTKRKKAELEAKQSAQKTISIECEELDYEF